MPRDHDTRREPERTSDQAFIDRSRGRAEKTPIAANIDEHSHRERRRCRRM